MKNSIVRGIVFFAVVPAITILGGLFWSDFFVLDTPAHPANWEYVVGPIMVAGGFITFLGFVIYGSRKERQ